MAKKGLPSSFLGVTDGNSSVTAGSSKHRSAVDTTLCSSLDDNSQDDLDTVDGLFSASHGFGTNGSGLADTTGEDSNEILDPERTRAAIKQLQGKIVRTMERIKGEQSAKEENVNEYLKLSASADRQQSQRIKTLFEKRNQKSTQTIAQLQRKMESYQKRRDDVETFGVTGHKKPAEMLKDMGQGLKGLFVRDNFGGRGCDRNPTNVSTSHSRDVGTNIREGITGFSGTIVSKPKEFAHLIKNKFGSADNINHLRNLEESQGSTDEGDKHSHLGSNPMPSSGYKAYSDEDASSITSGSGPSATQSSPHPQSQTHSNQPSISVLEQLQITIERHSRLLEGYHEKYLHMDTNLESLKGQISCECAYLKQTVEEERYRNERLEEQINDLTELHQHEVTNIKQELSSMEEKMEYQLEERTRDMQELLETCQTRITKMELQQQQQQLISVEGIENSNFRALITKLINVVLAVLAVIFVFVSTIANLLGPFLTTRLRILSTVFLVACMVATWQHWSLIDVYTSKLIDKYRHIVPSL